MKRILICIPNFGTTNREHLKRVLKEFCTYKNYTLTVHLLLTDEFDTSSYTALTIVKHLYPKTIGESLPHTHKPIFEREKDHFDYFLYLEDDLLLTESLIEVFREEEKNLPLQMACGFLRYEQKESVKGNFLIDCHPEHSRHRGGNDVIIKNRYLIHEREYLELYNVHQGCYLLSRQQLSEVLNSGKYFLDFWQGGYAGLLESAASDVFYRCGIIKVIPRDKIPLLLLHHLPNKYINRTPDTYRNYLIPTDTQLQELNFPQSPTP